MIVSEEQKKLLKFDSCFFCYRKLNVELFADNKSLIKNCNICDSKYTHRVEYYTVYMIGYSGMNYSLGIYDQSEIIDFYYYKQYKYFYSWNNDEFNSITKISFINNVEKYDRLYFDLVSFAKNTNIDEAIKQINLLNLFS